MVKTVKMEATEEAAPKRIKPSNALDQYAKSVADALERFWTADGTDGDSLLGGQLTTDQVLWHDSLLPGRDLVGLQQLKALRTALRAAVPDLSLRLARPLHSGEQGLVLGYWKAEGTHSGALGPSLPASGVRAAWEGSIVVRTSQQPAEAQQAEAGQGGEEAVPGKAGEGEEGGKVEEAKGGLQGVEVWWSWDPIFLFRQLGWRQETPAATVAAAVAVAGSKEGASNADAAPAADADADAGISGGGEQPATDLAAQTAAAARAAYPTEAAAAEAAAAAVAAAAAAAERVGESAEALAAVQAANRGVVELYFHTYNTGHYSVLDHIVDPDYHYDGLLDLGDRRGRAAMSAMMGGWRDCLPDLAIGHELFAAVGADKVTFRWVIRGTHATPGSVLLGVPVDAHSASNGGARLLVKGMTTLTLRGGRICRKVSHANAAHTLAQLGAAEHPLVALELPAA